MSAPFALDKCRAPAVQGNPAVGTAQIQPECAVCRDRPVFAELHLLERSPLLIGDGPRGIGGDVGVIPAQGDGPALAVGEEADQHNAAAAGLAGYRPGDRGGGQVQQLHGQTANLGPQGEQEDYEK